MKAIQENPYRVLGVWAGATEREIVRQQTRLKAYLDVRKEVQFDTDLALLQHISRTPKIVQSAVSAIEKTAGKIEHSLFWFSNFTPIDKIALKHLSTGHLQKAIDIWTKPVSQNNKSLNKISALNNLGTIKLLLSTRQNGSTGKFLFKDGFNLKCQLFLEESMRQFADAFKDATFKTDDKAVERIAIKFFTKVKQLTKNGSILGTDDITSVLSNQNGKVRDLMETAFTSDSVSAIESSVQQAKKTSLDDPASANVAGKHLFSRSIEHVKYLEKVLGHSNMKCRMLSDMVADELLQCSIVYYNHHTKGHKIDPGDDALLLIKKAKQVAVGSSVKKRIEKNLPVVQEWVANKSQRENRQQIIEEYDYIYDKISAVQYERNIFTNNRATIRSAENLVKSCKPKLTIIRSKLGTYSSDYEKISSDVVTISQGLVVQAVNKAQEDLKKPSRYGSSNFPFDDHLNPRPIYSYESVANLRELISYAYEVMHQINSMKMSPDLRSSFRKNFNVIEDIHNNLKPKPSYSNTYSNSNGGCYIATMAYCSYDHPQVLRLRTFRDKVLAKSIPGRWFIQIYYAVSPKLVQILKGNQSVNRFTRKCLDLFIQLIQK